MPAPHSSGFIEEKTATYNRLRGLISEFGVIAPQSTDALRHMVSAQKNSLPLQVQQCVDDLLEHVARIEANIAEYDRILSRMAKTDHRSQRLMELKGIGPTTACALVASIGNAHDFKNGRQLAAWLGLTLSQYSSGGKSKLGRITKAGDSYLRTLLVQGARSVLIGVEKGLIHSVVGFAHWSNAEDTGALLLPSLPKCKTVLGIIALR